MAAKKTDPDKIRVAAVERKLMMIVGDDTGGPAHTWRRLEPMLVKFDAVGGKVPDLVSDWIKSNPKQGGVEVEVETETAEV